MRSSTAEDEAHLRRALALAARGQGRVEPNPMVGCVIVRHGRVIGEGYHHRFGGPHAEVDALRRCRESPRGATVYVTLEPCCHWGKTPPCTEALLAAGVSRVVAPMTDPNPPVAGRGFAQLRRGGVRVDLGLLADQAADLNAPYFKLTRERRPWVILKWAQSLDGRIATRTGDSKWISDQVCRDQAHRIRGRVDAILVGVGTVLADDPLLTCRVGRPRRVAVRVVLDTHLRMPPDCRLVRTVRRASMWVFCGPAVAPRRVRRLEQAGCVVRPVSTARGRVSLPAVLDALGREQMTNVLVEGGSAVLGSFLDQRLANEIRAYVAPLLIGGDEAPGALGGRGAGLVVEAARQSPATTRWRRLGAGLLVTARLP